MTEKELKKATILKAIELYQERYNHLINNNKIDIDIIEYDDKKIIINKTTEEPILIGRFNNILLQQIKINNYKFDIKIHVKVDIVIDGNISKKNKIIAYSPEIIEFSNCIFYKKFHILNNPYQEAVYHFKNSVFKGNTSFENSVFDSKVRFHYTNFKSTTSFRNSSFKDLVDFYCAKFYCSPEFTLSDFLKIAVFSSTEFHKQVQFIYCKVDVNSYISFQNAIFHQSLDLSSSNFYCKTSFWGVNFKRTIPEESDLYNSIDEYENQHENNYNYLKKIRETYRIIKQSFITEGNYIESANFHQKELLVYMHENKIKKNILKSLIDYLLFKNFNNRFSLFLNYLSNDFGKSWTRAFWFIVIINLIFTVILLCSLDKFSNIFEDKVYNIELDLLLIWDKIFKFISNFLQLLNITEWDTEFYGNKLKDKPIQFIILFISRIFTGYGIYQLVQAFKKDGKN